MMSSLVRWGYLDVYIWALTLIIRPSHQVAICWYVMLERLGGTPLKIDKINSTRRLTEMKTSGDFLDPSALHELAFTKRSGLGSDGSQLPRSWSTLAGYEHVSVALVLYWYWYSRIGPLCHLRRS